MGWTWRACPTTRQQERTKARICSFFWLLQDFSLQFDLFFSVTGQSDCNTSRVIGLKVSFVTRWPLDKGPNMICDSAIWPCMIGFNLTAATRMTIWLGFNLTNHHANDWWLSWLINPQKYEYYINYFNLIFCHLLCLFSQKEFFWPRKSVL